MVSVRAYTFVAKLSARFAGGRVSAIDEATLTDAVASAPRPRSSPGHATAEFVSFEASGAVNGEFVGGVSGNRTVGYANENSIGFTAAAVAEIDPASWGVCWSLWLASSEWSSGAG